MLVSLLKGLLDFFLEPLQNPESKSHYNASIQEISGFYEEASSVWKQQLLGVEEICCDQPRKVRQWKTLSAHR